jgi:hypothetical protein
MWVSVMIAAMLGQQGEPREPRPRPERVERADSDAPAWTLAVRAEFSDFDGWTRVREWDSEPATLDLEGDLGVGVLPGGRATLSRETRATSWFVEGEIVRGGGEGVYDVDFAYDEGEFKAGVPFETRAEFFFARGGVAFKRALWDGENGSLGPLVAVEWVRGYLGIFQEQDDSTENYTQFMPYPIAGLAGEWRLGSSLTIGLRAYAGYVPRMPTIFHEGGTMHMEVHTASVEVELAWQISAGARLTVGAGYRFWYGRLDSAEDDNELSMGGPQVTVGLEIRW